MRRKHSKITRELPPELVEAVNEKIVQGFTYEQIADWLKGMGHEVSRSAVGRYSKDFLTRLERLKMVKDQAKAIVEDAAGEPDTAMAEAAGKIAFQVIMEALLEASDKGPKGLSKTIVEAMKALAQLERSAVGTQRLKYEFHRGVETAVAKLKAALREELTQAPDLQARLVELVDRTREQVSA